MGIVVVANLSLNYDEINYYQTNGATSMHIFVKFDLLNYTHSP